MTQADLEKLIADANQQLDSPGERIAGSDSGADPRFELYHFAMSLSSWKVRLALIEKGVPFISHDISILPPRMQNYVPGYVRLRLAGRQGLPLVGGYTGRSSIETEGLDACVVPTLVDLTAREIVNDSRVMCHHIDEQAEGPELIPSDLADAIVEQLKIVDRAPQVALLYGEHPDEDVRPAKIREKMPHIHDFKLKTVNEYMATVGDDPELVAAYESKIVKESKAKEFVRTPDRMRAAIEDVTKTMQKLDADLRAHPGDLFFGERFTMADVAWSIALFRLKWLGMGYLWKDLPELAAYGERMFARPNFRRAVIEWPGNPPSEHVQEHYA